MEDAEQSEEIQGSGARDGHGPRVAQTGNTDTLATRDTNLDREGETSEQPISNSLPYLIRRTPIVLKAAIGNVMHQQELPDFLDDIQRHPALSTLPFRLNEPTRINIWHSIRVRVPPSPHYPYEELCRIYAKPTIGDKPAQFDTIMFTPSATTGNSETRASNTSKLRDYSIGRLRLLFSLSPTAVMPNPPTMAYVHLFTSPGPVSAVSGFHGVGKCMTRGNARHAVIFASQIVRPCPLSPIFCGEADRDVKGTESLSHYDKFYVNKYRHPRDFCFIHEL